MKALKALSVVVFLLVAAGMAFGGDIEVSQPAYLTGNGAFDRNPSITFDGTDYWLFYTQGDDISTLGIRGSGYDPDADTYVVYYKKAGSIAGLATAAEVKLDLSETNRPADFSQRVASAVSFGGKMYCFVSSGQDGTNRGLYYYVNDAGTWSGPVELISDATARGAHVNVATDGSRIYIVWESSDGSSDCYTWNGTTLSSKIDISNNNMPKITVMQSKLSVVFVVGIEDGTEDIEVYYSVGGPTPLFNPHSTALPGSGLYDPCIFNDGTDLYVVSAPYVAADRQYLIQTKFDALASTWSDAKVISYGGYGTTEWWEFWPCGYYDGANAYVFFTTETDNGPTFGDGEIAVIKMSWDLSRDHYFHIQNACDYAIGGDVIHIAAGTYTEQVHITTDALTLEGAGVDNVIVKSPVALSSSFVTGTYNNYPVIFIDGVSTDISNLTIDGDNQGDANYRFVGLAYWNGGGIATDLKVFNIMNSTFSGAQHGVGIYSYNNTGGPYSITLSDVLVDDFQKTAVALSGSGLTVDLENVTTIGEGATGVTAQNGIQVGPGVTGTVDDCSISLIAYTGESWTATGFLNYGNTIATNVDIDQCQTSVYWSDGTGTFDLGTITNPLGDGFYAYNSTAKSSGPRLQPQPFGDIAPATDKTPMSVTLSNSVITGVGTEYSWGVGAFSTSSDDVALTVTGCDISDWDYGYYAYDYGGGVTSIVSDNSITSCTYALGSNMTTIQDGSGNWFGTTDPTEVAAMIEGDFDYTPWLDSGSDISGDPGFQGDFATLWVDDDSPQSGAIGRVQEGINLVTGSTVNVLPGAYEEQVVIDKDVVLIGGGKETTTIQSPALLSDHFSTSADNYPVVYIHDVDNAEIEALTVDGQGFGNANYKFMGVAFWNAGGSITDCRVTNIINTPFSGSQHGVAIYSYNTTGGPYEIEVSNTEVDEFQKNGITLLGEGLTFDINGCTVTGKGVTSTIAQNGIQTGYGSGGTITDCNVTGFTWDGPTWYDGGLLIYDGTTTDVSGCVCDQCQVSIWFIGTSGSVDNCTASNPTADGVYVDNYAAKNLSGRGAISAQPVEEAYQAPALKAMAAVSITNSTFTGTDASGYAGIYPWAEDAVTISVDGCNITNWDYGCMFEDHGGAIEASINYTRLHDNISYGAYADPIAVVDAEHNWWGDVSGPYHATRHPLGTGTAVTDNIDFEPWCNYDFTVCDYGESPAITLNAPPDGSIIPDPFVELSATVSDESLLDIRVYGDRNSDPSNLLYAEDGVVGVDTDILYNWTAQVLNPEATNTIGLWHFDENSGAAVIDASDYGNTGSFMNFDDNPWTAGGRFGYAIDFDGEDDYIEIPDLDNSLDVDPATGALTIEAWLNPRTTGGGIYRAFVSKRDSAYATMVNYALYLDDASGALSLYNGNFPAGFYISNIVVPTNEWSFIAVSMDASEGILRFYLNGVPKDSISGATFGPMHNGDLQIGTSKTPSANRDYDGLIDEVRLTKRVLSPAEIAANYTLNGGTFYWKVTASDGTQTTISDTWHFMANDTILPTVEVLSPDAGLTWDHQPTLEIAFGDDAGIDQAFYQINDCGGAWTEFWPYNSGVLDTTISWLVPELPNGTYSIYFKVVDDAGNVNEDVCSFSWDFTKLTMPPSITSTPPTDGYTGGLYTYDVDAGGIPAPHFSLLSAIFGMDIDTLTGIITWTPEEAGDVSVSVRADNSVGFDVQNYTLSVFDTLNPEIILVSPENGSSTVGFGTDLQATVNDHSDFTVWVYGDKYPGATGLLYVASGLSSPDIEYNWQTAIMQPDPPYTRGLWHLNENAGTTVGDVSFQDNTGTTIGSPDWTESGQFGYALDFDGTNDRIAVSDDASLDIDSTAGKLTIEAWIYPRSSGLYRDRAIVAKRNTTSTLQNYSLWLSDVSNRLAFAGSDIAMGGWKVSSIAPPWDEWSYVAVTIDAATGLAVFYVINEDGVTVDTVSGVHLGVANDDTLMIGGGGGLENCFDGFIDEVRLTGKVYSYQEIKDNSQLEGNYYWKVRAQDAFGNETTSPVQYFYAQTYVCGDANGDGMANIGDAVFIISYAFRDGPAPNPMRAADANGDGEVNIGDAVFLINYAFRDGPPPIC